MVRQQPGGRPAAATAKDRQRRRDEHGGQACSVQHGMLHAMLACERMVEPLTVLEIQSQNARAPRNPPGVRSQHALAPSQESDRIIAGSPPSPRPGGQESARNAPRCHAAGGFMCPGVLRADSGPTGHVESAGRDRIPDRPGVLRALDETGFRTARAC